MIAAPHDTPKESMKNSCAVLNCPNPLEEESPVLHDLKVSLCKSHTAALERSIQRAMLESEALGIGIPMLLILKTELQSLLFPGDQPRLTPVPGGLDGNTGT